MAVSNKGNMHCLACIPTCNRSRGFLQQYNAMEVYPFSVRVSLSVLQQRGEASFSGLPYPHKSNGTCRVGGTWCLLSQNQFSLGTSCSRPPSLNCIHASKFCYFKSFLWFYTTEKWARIMVRIFKSACSKFTQKYQVLRRIKPFKKQVKAAIINFSANFFSWNLKHDSPFLNLSLTHLYQIIILASLLFVSLSTLLW